VIVDHDAINSDFDLRKYALKPSPEKQNIIIAQIEVSGVWQYFLAPALKLDFDDVIRANHK
jgi:hypothetical protein